jgi:hypothetical protein
MSHDDSTHTCACGGNCGCQDQEQTQRVYQTKEEYISRLEQYLGELQAEIVAVQKELVMMKAPVELVNASTN